MQALYDRIMKEGRSFGNAGLGMVELCRQSGTTIEGMGFLVEKAFENGRKPLEAEGITRIESLAIIESVENNEIRFKAF